jgi:hypothetical protein
VYAVVESRDRFWEDTRSAGHRAYQRGNYEYAQRMYHEALEQAEDLDPGGRLVVASLLDLGRVYEARGRADSAALYRERARALQAGR